MYFIKPQKCCFLSVETKNEYMASLTFDNND